MILSLLTLLATGSLHSLFFCNFANTRKGIGAWGNHLLLFRQISVDDFRASATAAGSGGEHLAGRGQWW